MNKLNKQRGVSLIITIVMVTLVLVGCGKKTASRGDEPIKIGILQLIDQTALTDARKGFEAELAEQGYKGKKIEIDYVNAQGDQSNLRTMSEKLKKDDNVVNLALATPAAQALQKVDPDTPMVFTAITDPIVQDLRLT